MLSRESLAKEEFKDLMVTLYDDLPALCKSLFPDIFVADFCNIHNEIFNAIADKEKRFKLSACLVGLVNQYSSCGSDGCYLVSQKEFYSLYK